METVAPSELPDLVGTWSRTSDWITIDQSRIDTFADITEDHQFIHVDRERAAQTPFGTTIAHGFLTLSLLSGMGSEVMLAPQGIAMGLNYGFEKVRFLQPVKCGQRVRGTFALTGCKPRGSDFLLSYEITVAIDGEDKPALVATWLNLAVMGQGDRA